MLRSMRDFIVCYINGKRHELTGKQAFMTMADYLRYQKSLTGTKIVCAEGDCGACSVVVSKMVGDKFTEYKSINSCIAKMYLYDRSHIITVEGLGNTVDMHPVQAAFVDEHGAQCGYCTPGFICAMANMANDLKASGKNRSEQKVKNYLTGNLCRCTGYEPIINAGMKVNLNMTKPLSELYQDEKILADLKKLTTNEVKICDAEREIYLPDTFENACNYKSENTEAKLISGATDLGVVENKGKLSLQKTLSLNHVNTAYKIINAATHVEIGAKVTLSEIEKELAGVWPEFTKMLHIFASPQIKNAATLVGNLVNASPIADTIPFLMVAEAIINLASPNGERQVDINQFFKGGYKELDLRADELVKSITIPKSAHDYKLYKVSPRKDLDISTVTFAARYKIDGDCFKDINLAFGGVGPKVLRVTKVESKARGQKLAKTLFSELSLDVLNEVTPLSDHRGSQKYRNQLCSNLLLRFGDEVMQNSEANL